MEMADNVSLAGTWKQAMIFDLENRKKQPDTNWRQTPTVLWVTYSEAGALYITGIDRPPTACARKKAIYHRAHAGLQQIYARLRMAWLRLAWVMTLRANTMGHGAYKDGIGKLSMFKMT
jgi:hypothetical protein